MFSRADLERRTAAAEPVRRALENAGVRYAQMEIPDNNAYLRAKLVGLDKALSATGTGVSTAMVSVRSPDQLVMTDFSNFENGFPKMVAVPDLDTAVRLPWRGNSAAVLCDLYMEDGTPCPMDTRQLLRRAVAEYERLGLHPRVALEYEFYVFEENDALMREQRYGELKSFGRGWDFYTLTRFPAYDDLAREFMTRMESIGIEVEAFHTEYGHGMFEYTMTPQAPLKAADDAVRAKLHLKQLCAERGLVPSFMATLHVDTGDSSSGCHHNFSIAKDGLNAFWDPQQRTVSQLARHVAGGILDTMPDFNIVFRPWVNSFRRMDRLHWNPQNASWGLDNHTAGLRVVHGSLPEKYTRFEHRAPGADINPYLSLACMLLGGLSGIRNKREPGEYAIGDAMLDKRWSVLPATMPAAIEAFAGSAAAKELLGEQFVKHYAAVRAAEWEEFAVALSIKNGELPKDKVTQWELEHYFSYV